MTVGTTGFLDRSDFPVFVPTMKQAAQSLLFVSERYRAGIVNLCKAD